MIKLTIRSERCKACGLCIAHCPQQLLRPSEKFNEAGHHATVQDRPEECTGCGLCALMCPDVCFTIVRIEEGTAEVKP
ncbi:MAG: 4Fe-4S binding protein [Armatimonadetes bacterium]|nr:4Fe-4S binding protein [Armatimonadota bacterium]